MVSYQNRAIGLLALALLSQQASANDISLYIEPGYYHSFAHRQRDAAARRAPDRMAEKSPARPGDKVLEKLIAAGPAPEKQVPAEDKTAVAAPADKPVQAVPLPTMDGILLQADDPIAKIASGQAPVPARGDLWTRIRGGFAIPDLDSPLVQSHVDAYTAKPENVEAATQRASKYLFHVAQELDKRGMPMELALLPFVESSFNPLALSPAKASGIWQFMPATAQNFHLKLNIFKDERRDIVASTDAALTYLQKLHDMFGDWQLALAAYNWGEGSVQRALNRNRAAGLGTDFASISPQMPAETRNYVPRLLAFKAIVASPSRYGVTLANVDDEPYFTAVAKTRDIDVKVAAKLAEMPVEEFRALNPQFNRPVIAGGENTRILVPASRAETFKVNLVKWKDRLSSWTVHTVTGARESIAGIAKRFGTTPETIREVNHIPVRMQVAAGSTILVPKTEATAADGDIRAEVADNARVALVAEHSRKAKKHKRRARRRHDEDDDDDDDA